MLLEEEHRARLSWAVKEGVELALSKKPIPMRFFEAIEETAEGAGRRAFRVNTDRKERAVGM